MKLFTTILGLALLLSGSSLTAGVPNTVNYQGRLTDAAGDAVPDGAILVKFQIYDAATGGTVLWNSTFQTVNVSNGLFSYDLGANVTLPDLFSSDTVRYLGITVGTDPEISPRTRFTCSGYVFEAQKSDIADLAMNADSLGGQHPSYYLDWANMTSIPAGFADGVDDAGIYQATADGRYLLKAGDTLLGNLFGVNADGMTTFSLYNRTIGGAFSVTSGSSTNASSISFVGSSAFMQFTSPDGHQGVLLASTATNGGYITLMKSNGVANIWLSGGGAADLSVHLPDSAINSNEILDEPGIASNNLGGSGSVYTNTSTMTDIVTVTITCPTSGYVKIDAQCRALYNGTTGINQGWFQIDETAGGIWTWPYFTGGGADGFASPSENQRSIYCTRVFFKSAGTYTFRLEGIHYSASASGSTLQADNAIITAMFFPTSYGSVTTLASSNPGDNPTAKAVSVTNPDGSVSTGYKMDLRYYEEKARQAEIAAQKAELEKLQAQNELAQARQGGNEK